MLTSPRAAYHRGDLGYVSTIGLRSHPARELTLLSLEQNTGQIAANLPLTPVLYRALQEKFPPLPTIRSYLTPKLRSSHDASLVKRSGFSQVHEEGGTPLDTFPVRKTVDIDVNEERCVNKGTTWPLDMRYGNHSANVTV